MTHSPILNKNTTLRGDNEQLPSFGFNTVLGKNTFEDTSN